jgi:hypothetical protein
MKEAGLPDGVVNVIFGIGPRAGEAPINHEDVSVCFKTKILFLSHLITFKNLNLNFNCFIC